MVAATWWRTTLEAGSCAPPRRRSVHMQRILVEVAPVARLRVPVRNSIDENAQGLVVIDDVQVVRYVGRSAEGTTA